MIVENVGGDISNKVDFDDTQLSIDPRLRIPILDYFANIQDQVQRAYMLKGHCPPQDHE